MKTIDFIKRHIEETQPTRPTRGYLGMSGVGNDCKRALWYGYRFVTYPHFPAETLLKFADGHNSEDITADRIRAALPESRLVTHTAAGEQLPFSDINGHFRGHCDGIALNLPEFPDQWVIWEHKCSDRVTVNKLVRAVDKHGEDKALANWNYVYYVQAILYMYYGKLDQHIMTVSHSGSRDYVQVITPANNYQAEAVIGIAKQVIASDKPLAKLRDDPEYYKCKWCDHSEVCHGTAAPEVNCRTCVFSAPDLTGDDGKWICKKHHNFEIPMKTQVNGCDDHLYNPLTLGNFAKVIDATQSSVVYENTLTEKQFTNGKAAGDFTSHEIFSCEDKAMLGNAHIEEIKRDYGAQIVID